MKARKRHDGETTEQYLTRARRYARRRFDELAEADGWHSHDSFYAQEALENAEGLFPDLGTYGVEGDCEENGEDHITIQYLNTGDTYGLTLCYYRGRFVVSSWGNTVESLSHGR